MKLIQALFCFICINFFAISYAIPIVSNLVEPAKYFLNHEKEITDLSNRLELYNVSGLVGFSGMGKTELARKFAYRNQDKYDLIWFFDCNSDLTEQFVNLSKQINESNLCGANKCNLSEDTKTAKRDIVNLLTPKNNWLLVFDNLRINQNNKIADIIDWAHNGHVILGSQDSKDLPNSIHLPYLSDNDATNVVDTILERKNPEIVKDLVKIAKGYPILIVQGAMFLNENKHMTVKDYEKIISASDDKMRSHIEIVLKQLPESAKDMLYKIAVINNQQFSRKLLESITNKEDLPKNLDSITRFGLVNVTYADKDNRIFEMHDAIKEAILKIIGAKKANNIVTEVIEKINNSIPQGEGQTMLASKKDRTLKRNLETLLNNAEKYEVDVYRDMELRKNLIAGYLDLLDYYNCQKMADWLMNRQDKLDSFVTSLLMSDKQKAIYSEYLAVTGEYFDFAKSDFLTTIKYLNKAANVIKNVKNYHEVKFLIYSQLAQTYIYGGDIKNGEENLRIAENIAKNNSKAQLDTGLLLFIQAKLNLLKGKYNNSLKNIDDVIKIDIKENLPRDSIYSAPDYLMKAEILNYTGQFKEAYDIAKTTYEQQKKNIKGDHELHARALVQLAWAELQLGMNEEALKHIKDSVRIFDAGDETIGDGISANSYNTDLAAAYVVQGNVLSSTDGVDSKEVMDSYGAARRIYYNRYADNLYSVNDVMRFYFDAAQNLCKISNDKGILEKVIYTEFREKLIEHWGNTAEMKDLLELETKRNCRIFPNN